LALNNVNKYKETQTQANLNRVRRQTKDKETQKTERTPMLKVSLKEVLVPKEEDFFYPKQITSKQNGFVPTRNWGEIGTMINAMV
jgi:hypothetical protein